MGPVAAASLKRVDAGVGIGLRQPHYEQALEARVDLAFVEVHSENFFAAGGATRAVLRRARELYALSLHGVGLGLGSAAGIDAWHLGRLEHLVREVEPVRVSDHASFARVARPGAAAVLHANDLLPVAFTPAALDIMVRNVGVVQERLRRTILVENVSAYVTFNDAPMSEAEFLLALCRRSGCGVLLDLNNLMVNALNAAAPDPVAACCGVVDSLPREVVGEIHLAGYADTDAWAVDDHGSRVRPSVWQVYRHALRRFGAVPTLIEWDTEIPRFDVLLDEADRAVACRREAAA
ncbi:MAG: DUF692 domain-containing protein [Burkholderiaceae bacterium]